MHATGKLAKQIARLLVANSLSLSLLTLFVICIVGQSIAGLDVFNVTQAVHKLKPIDYWRYLGSSDFLEGVFSNWQAALLQLGSLIVLGIFLRQRGAPHSRKSAALGAPRRRRPLSGRARHWVWRNSLSLAFFGLFLGAFLLHLWAGTGAYNRDQAFLHQPQLSVAAYFISPQFWFSTFQTWQAEYIAIALYVVLSIFLRQQGSPESKPESAPDAETGEADTH